MPFFRQMMLTVTTLLVVTVGPLGAQVKPNSLERYEQRLATYRANLAVLRNEHRTHRQMPDLQFFLFGMGDRRKLIYQQGVLKDALTGDTLRLWSVRRQVIVPSDYTVAFETSQGQQVVLTENERGVFVQEGPKTTTLSERPLKLPDFQAHRYGPVLRVLHHEVLINVNQGLPVPNFFVYKKPWLRDATLMAMVMKQTGNLSLIKGWINSLREPFDRNNHGIAEADNPGQVLYLISLVANKSHPLVQPTLDSARQFVRQANGITYLEGKTDYALHPVFQTKWMKYGLKSLGLPDPYTIPKQYDSYSSLFWWDYKDQHVPGPHFDERLNTDYPYLVWAEDHFYGRPGTPETKGMVTDQDYPLSWESKASDAHYPGLAVLNPDLIAQKLSPPHTWHAAEMFLLLSSMP